MNHKVYLMGLTAMGMGAFVALALVAFEQTDKLKKTSKIIPVICGIVLLIIPVVLFLLNHNGFNYFSQLFVYIFEKYNYTKLVPDLIVGAVIYCLVSGGCFLLGTLIAYIIFGIVVDKLIDRKLKE